MLRMLKVDRWDAKKGALSEETARAAFKPEYCYRIFLRQMEEGGAFTGDAEERTLVVLDGSFTLQAPGGRKRLEPGDIAQVPAGEFVFESDGPVTFLAVYKLPPEMWPN